MKATNSFEAVLSKDSKAFIAQGDCLKRLKELPDNSIDAVVTDPPAGIAFMGKAWDLKKKEGMTELQAFQDFIFDVFTEVHRVLKPGGHAVVWALPRTAHHTTMGVERAGFEIRDVVHHVFGTGFPKSLDVSKALMKDGHTEAAERFNGFGTAMKPAAENWILARKPLIGTVASNVLEHRTGALNIDACRISTADNLNGGAYAKNPTERYDGDDNYRYKRGRAGLPGDEREGAAAGMYQPGKTAEAAYKQPTGRFPANFVLSHSDGCVQTGTKKVKASVLNQVIERSKSSSDSIGKQTDGHCTGFADADGKEEVEAWDCVEGCAVLLLDQQSGTSTSTSTGGRGYGKLGNVTYNPYNLNKVAATSEGLGDTGGASRFFYIAKAPASEKVAVLECGCTQSLKVKDIPVVPMKEAKVKAGTLCPTCSEPIKIHAHPTVKSISLMEWLVKLVSPPGGVVLDPFTGSGSTGVAAKNLGSRFIGVEQDKLYCALSRYRVKND